MTGPLVIDGAYGEGGGQILRSAVKLSAMSGQAVRIENIRAGRSKPGLAAQHVTSIRAAAAICGAVVAGDKLGSLTLTFEPQHPVRAGDYAFDVAEAREGGSAGATSLVMQTVLLPLAMADGESQVTLQGGTHMAWSPPFDYLRDVWLPALRPLGVAADIELLAWGWFPIGQGCIQATIRGRGGRRLAACNLVERGNLLEVRGRAVAANLPAHIPQRMADRARAILAGQGIPVEIRPERVRAACPGAGIFLTLFYERLACGVSVLGEKGKPSEEVAEAAAMGVFKHRNCGAALDLHLGDQILVPLALADRPSRFSVEQVSRHLETNAWLIRQFGAADIEIDRRGDGTGLVTVTPKPQVG